jgi:hypothetical protein
MESMRILLALALALIAALSGACAHRGPGPKFARPTGTCTGACDLYLWCKAESGQEVAERAKDTCELECAEVFSGAEPLAAFESLSCEDAIAFVEGQSGRGPGAVLADTQRAGPGADGETPRQRASKAPGADAP